MFDAHYDQIRSFLPGNQHDLLRGFARSDDLSDTTPLAALLGNESTKFRHGILDFFAFLHGIDRDQLRLKARGQVAREQGPAAARAWLAKNDPAGLRDALGKKLTSVSDDYAVRARQMYTQIDETIARTATVFSVLGAFALILAGIGVVVIRRSITAPIAEISRVTEAV
ncbi:MAG: hypothetical protein P8Z74_09290, partial [Acidobacteriota bacterium]